MPELPEVEVLRRSLEPLLAGERILGLRVRNPALREPVDRVRLGRAVRGREIRALRRRAKYLLFLFDEGVLINKVCLDQTCPLSKEEDFKKAAVKVYKA